MVRWSSISRFDSRLYLESPIRSHTEVSYQFRNTLGHHSSSVHVLFAIIGAGNVVCLIVDLIGQLQHNINHIRVNQPSTLNTIGKLGEVSTEPYLRNNPPRFVDTS